MSSDLTGASGGGRPTGGRIFRNGLIVWARIAGSTLATILTVRFVLSALGIEAFGVFAATVAIPLGLGFLTAAMQVNSQRALAMAGGIPGERQRIFNAILGLHLGVAAALVLSGAAIGQWMLNSVLVIPDSLGESARVVLVVTLAAAALGAVLSPYEALLQSDERFGVFALMDVLRAGSLLLASIWLGGFGGDRLAAYGWASAATTAGAALMGAVIASHRYAEARIRPRLLFDAGFCRRQMRLFSWTLFGSFSTVARNQGIVIVVNVFFGPVGSAAYGIGNQLQGALRQLSGAVATVLAPRIYRIEASGQRQRMIDASLASCRIATLVAIAFAIPLLAEVHALLGLWLGTPPPLTDIVVSLLVAGLLVDQLSAPVGTAHLAVGSIARYQLMCGLVAIAFVPVSYVAGRAGADLAFILAVLVLMSALITWLRIWLLESHSPGVSRSWLVSSVMPALAAAAPAALVAAAVVALLPPGPVRILITGAASGAAMLVSGVRFGLARNERAALGAELARWCR